MPYYHLSDFAEGFLPEEIVITSLTEAHAYHERFIEFRTFLKFTVGIGDLYPNYRGEQKRGWDIFSGIFRPPLKVSDVDTAISLEQEAINKFEKTIIDKIGDRALRQIFNKEKHGKDWDLLFQAQHAGIKTTLTDWSGRIDRALYFAVEKSDKEEVENSDGQLWCLMTPVDNMITHDQFFPKHSFYNLSPFDTGKSYLINPSSYLDQIEERIFEYRMYKQLGKFIKSSKDTCNVPLNKHPEFSPFMFNIRIPQENKADIRDQLMQSGLTREFMYVDEDPKYQYLIDEINAEVFKSVKTK